MYEVFARNEHQLLKLAELERSLQYDFWTPIQLDSPVDIMISPEQLDDLLTAFLKNGIQYRQKITDVQK